MNTIIKHFIEIPPPPNNPDSKPQLIDSDFINLLLKEIETSEILPGYAYVLTQLLEQIKLDLEP